MARVNKGNALTTIKLQPGWTIEDDGFGLLTARATYVISQDTDYGVAGAQVVAKAPKRGDYFENDPRLVCHRSSSSINSNGLQVITADYCGISSGNMTSPQVSGRGATTTEPIQRHPWFVKFIAGTKASPLNGAEFNDDGSFKVFAEPTNKKFGLKSYYSPAFTISGFFYTSDITVAKKLKDAQCLSSTDGKWAGIDLLSGFKALGSTWGTSVPYFMAADESPQLLLTSMSLEYYGNLFKVSYEILVAVDGLDYEVYPFGSGPRPNRNA
jgi:hypothetical protein